MTTVYKSLFEVLPQAAFLVARANSDVFTIVNANQSARNTWPDALAETIVDHSPVANEAIQQLCLRVLAQSEAIWAKRITFPTNSDDAQYFNVHAAPLEGDHILLSLERSDDTPTATSENDTATLFERMKDRAPIMMHQIDASGRIVSVSDQWLMVLGYERDEVLGKLSTSFLTTASRVEAREIHFPILHRLGYVQDVPYQFVCKDGSLRDVLLTAFTEHAQDQAMFRGTAILIDITERERLAQEVAIQQKKWTRAEELAHVGHWQIDLVTQELQWSDEVYRIHGQEPETYHPKLADGINAYHPDDQDRVAEVVSNAIEHGESFEFELRLVRPTGEIRHVQSYGECTVSESGQTTAVFGVFLDITQRKEIELALAAERARVVEALAKYKLIANNSQDLVCLHEPDGSYSWISPSIQTLLGYSPTELLGTSPYNLFHPEDLERIRSTSHKANLDGELSAIRYRILHKNGTYRWFETLSRPIVDDDETILQLQTQSRDVTDREQAMLQLGEQEARMRAILESSVQSIVTINNDGYITSANPATERLFGYPTDELLGQNVRVLMPSPDRENHDGYMAHYHHTGEKRIIGLGRQVKAQHRSGGTFPILLTISEVLLSDGPQYTGMMLDISEQVRTEEALRQQASRMRLLYELSLLREVEWDDSLTIALERTTSLLDLEIGIISQIDESTDSYTVLAAYAPKHSIAPGAEFELGKTYCSIMYASDEPLGIPHMAISPHRRHPCYEAFQLETYLGIPIYVDGERYGTLNFSSTKPRTKDFTEADFDMMYLLSNWVSVQIERKQADTALRTYAAELKQSNDELEQFAYVASHDLQEPLRTIHTMIDLLASRNPDFFVGENEKMMAFVLEAAVRMRSLIKDLLTFSRVGRMDVKKAPVVMESVLTTTLESMLVTIHEHQAQITHDPLPVIHADATQMGMLLQNIIGNGIKYRRDERPHIHISVEEEDEQWVFHISDNGIGIDEKYYDRIFEVFKRLHRREEFEGTGIGLAVCKRIIQRHGGDIHVTSVLGEGSTFTFSLPR